MGMHDGNEVHAWKQDDGSWLVQEIVGGIVDEPARYADEDEARKAVRFVIEFGHSVENHTEFEITFDPSDGHEADPTSTSVYVDDGWVAGPTVCSLCDKPVHWTGTNYDESPTGKTIPGPWIHTEGGE